jgi:GDP/UDP-N,N'-diacetylbacillosamine 2-epimerase (hydrolysing)
MTKEELESSLGQTLGDKYAVGTFHPVTLEVSSAKQQTEELLAAIAGFPDITFLFTKANADADGRVINKMLGEYAEEHSNVLLYDSLGMRRYLSAVSGAEFVIGNSSSGLIEVPSFHVPTINIGDRQKGRIQGDTIINCKPERSSIVNAIEKACDNMFRMSIKNSVNPYGDGNTSEKIISIIKKMFKDGAVQLKKEFYDVE